MGAQARCLETSRVTVERDPGGPWRHLTHRKPQIAHHSAGERLFATRQFPFAGVREPVPSDCQVAVPRPLFSWDINVLPDGPSCSCAGHRPLE